jgi:hypothetical protein
MVTPDICAEAPVRLHESAEERDAQREEILRLVREREALSLDTRTLGERAWDRSVADAEIELLDRARVEAIKAQATLAVFELLRARVEERTGLHVD